MADRGMIFSAPMVRALLEGRKTQTRRVLKPQPIPALCWDVPDGHYPSRAGWSRIPYVPGDRLWVRENFMPAPMEAPPVKPRPTRWSIAYSAGGQAEIIAPAGYNPMLYNYELWSPSIHMPRWASRLTLVVTDVRVQRLHDISEADAVAEGVERGDARNHLIRFFDLWDELHGWGARNDNPWVCALTFTVHRCNIDRMEADNA